MEYSENFTENEDQKTVNGQRKIITYPMLKRFLGSDNYHAKVEELALDMLNHQHDPEDAIADILEHTEA